MATYFDHNESFCELHSYKCQHCKKKLVGHFASSELNENCFCDKCKTLEVVIKMMEDEDSTKKQNINKTKQKQPTLQDWEPTWSDSESPEADMDQKSEELNEKIKVPSKSKTQKTKHATTKQLCKHLQAFLDEMKGFSIEDCELDESTELLEHNFEMLKKLCQKETIKITDATMYGRNFEIHMKLDSSIQQVKEAVMNFEGILPEYQQIFHEGHELVGDKTLKNYGIQKECTLKLVVQQTFKHIC